MEFDATGEDVNVFGYQAVTFIFSQVVTLPTLSQSFSADAPLKIARVGWFTPEATIDVSGGGALVYAFSPFHWIDFENQVVGIPTEANVFDSLKYVIYPGGLVHFWVIGP